MKTINIPTFFGNDPQDVTVERWQTFAPIRGCCKFTLKVRFSGHERLFKAETNDTEFYDRLSDMSY